MKIHKNELLKWEIFFFINALMICKLVLTHAVESYGGVRFQVHSFGTMLLSGSELSALRIACFTPRRVVPRTHWKGGWVDPRAILDALEKLNLQLPGIKLQFAHVQPVV